MYAVDPSPQFRISHFQDLAWRQRICSNHSIEFSGIERIIVNALIELDYSPNVGIATGMWRRAEWRCRPQWLCALRNTPATKPRATRCVRPNRSEHLQQQRPHNKLRRDRVPCRPSHPRV